MSEEILKWGLHSVAKTLKFINDEAASVHGNIRASSIYTSESGEWKIAGLEILSSMKEDDAVIFTQGSLVPDIGRYTPPEVVKGGWDSVRRNPTHAVDAYNYGILVSEVFNAGFSGTDQIGSTKNIPVNMQNSYKRLTHALPKMRLSVAHFLEQGTRNASFFDTPLIQLTSGVDNMGLKSETEKDAFIRYVGLSAYKPVPADFRQVSSKKSLTPMSFLKTSSKSKFSPNFSKPSSSAVVVLDLSPWPCESQQSLTTTSTPYMSRL